jgi:hypothetical protein
MRIERTAGWEGFPSYRGGMGDEHHPLQGRKGEEK